jgi:hypothetical protein
MRRPLASQLPDIARLAFCGNDDTSRVSKEMKTAAPSRASSECDDNDRNESDPEYFAACLAYLPGHSKMTPNRAQLEPNMSKE